VTDQAMVWIRERDTRPLFLFIHYYDVHSDYSSLPQYERLFVQPYSEVADGTGWQLARANRSIRRGRYKLIHNSKEDSWALYDLELDPGETLDIAAKEPEITAELSAEIRSRYAGFDPNPEPPNRIELDREELERLRALGYVP
jgi:arylsulfatase A-like enzyme